jgi:hypothetical protein
VNKICAFLSRFLSGPGWPDGFVKKSPKIIFCSNKKLFTWKTDGLTIWVNSEQQ